MSDADNRTRMAKPAKPSPDYPLTPRGDGRWCKKVRGRMHYFRGTPGEALAEYRRQEPYLLDGREPPPPPDGPAGATLGDLCNMLLTAKEDAVRAGRLSARTFAQWKGGTDLLVSHFGVGRDPATLGPAEFSGLFPVAAVGKDGRPRGVHSLVTIVATVRGVLKYAYESGVIDRPARFGPDFKPPSKARRRKAKRASGPRLIRPGEFRDILAAADPACRAWALLGLNAAYGPSDLATLPASGLDLAGAWAAYPRPKTGADRKAALWPETVDAVGAALAARPDPYDPADDGLAFLTAGGRRLVESWITPRGTVTNRDHVAKRWRAARKAAGVTRPGLGFYTLRRTFRTVADELLDQPTADLVMGHAAGDMAAVYRQTIGEGRLRAVAEHVRGWAFGG